MFPIRNVAIMVLNDGGYVAVMVHDGGSGGFGFGGDADNSGHGKRMGVLWSPALQEILWSLLACDKFFDLIVIAGRRDKYKAPPNEAT